LVRILCGNTGWNSRNTPLNSKAQGQDEFGALAFCSQAGIGRLVDRLLQGGFLQERKLDNGGIVLELAPTGSNALQDPSQLDRLLTPPAAAKSPLPRKRPPNRNRPSTRDDHADLKVDKALFEKLRAWRGAQAHAEQVPPYRVFHNSHLQAIASHCPTTLEALSQVKGVGEARLSKYGTAVIELITTYLDKGHDLDYTK
jgi:superfamily II DNA helicase RecQ